MDPLSVASSIVGLIVAAVQVCDLLKRFSDSAKEAPQSAVVVIGELTGINLCLNQLQGYLLGKQQSSKSRRSLVMIEQLIVVLTECVSVFSELEQTLEMLKTDHPMKLIDRVKWAKKEPAIARLLQRLQMSKSSLTLMLTTLTW